MPVPESVQKPTLIGQGKLTRARCQNTLPCLCTVRMVTFIYVAIGRRQNDFIDSHGTRLVDTLPEQVVVHDGSGMKVFGIGAELAGQVTETDRLDKKPLIRNRHKTPPEKFVLVQKIE